MSKEFSLFFTDFALAKHMPPLGAALMRIVYNTFSYLEGVIIQGMISGSLYSRVRNSLTLRHADPKKNIKIHLSYS